MKGGNATKVLLMVWMALTLATCTSIERGFLPDARLIDSHWESHALGSHEVLNHAPWDRFLATYVTIDDHGAARVRYGDVTTADRDALNQYISKLSKAPLSRMPRDRQRAFWINLYNALTVDLVLDHYPVKSIRKIKPGFLPVGPWDMELITVEGRRLTLNDIEHRILRPLWQDPRIHYALNCAAAGCPNLQRQAFTADNTEALLEAGALAFINDPRGVEFDRRGRLTVSKIYAWFKEDFGGTVDGVLDHLRHYAGPELSERLADTRRIARYRYDWPLNEAKGEPGD